MLKNYTPSQRRTEVRYDLVFDDWRGNGFWFPCDMDGNLLNRTNEAAMENYKWCLEHPEKFARFNKVVKQEYTVRDNAHGTCSCGNEVELYNAYDGACECEKCGKWYNLFGQELLPPTDWEEDY